MRSLLSILAGFSLCFVFLTSCAHHGVALDSQKQGGLPANAVVSVAPGDGRIGTYTSSNLGFYTSTYWIEGPQGLILIDTQFLPSAAEQALNWSETITGKKVVMAIVLHPNPDKFNGTATHQKRGIRVITSEQVLSQIPAVHEKRLHWFYERFKPDYPLEAAKPESFGGYTHEIVAAGLRLKLHVLGKGCSDSHVVAEYDGHVFTGDLVTNGFHSWLELGYLEEWIERIHEIRELKPAFVHPGRGASGNEDLLDHQESYLKAVIAVVKAAKPHGKPTGDQLDELRARVEALYPDYLYSRFISNGLEALWIRYRTK